MALVPVYPTSRDQIPSALEANLRMFFLEKLSAIVGLYEKIYNVKTTEIKIEREAVYAGVGTFNQKEEGQPVAFDGGSEAWNHTYTAKTFALGIQVTMEAVEDDLHGIIRAMTDRGGDLAAVAAYTKERDAMNLFNNLLTSGTVYTAGGTNYPLLSTTQFRADGLTWSNRPNAPMDVSLEAYEYMINHWWQNQVNQRGQLLGTHPDRLMVGTVDWALARRIIRSTGLPTTNNNDPNVLRDYITEDPLAHPLMTNDGRWLAFAPKEDTGLQYYERVKPEIRRWPDDNQTGNMIYICYYRAVWGATHVSGVWGSP